MSEEFELSVVGSDWPQGLYCLASALYLFSILHLGVRAWLDKNLEEKSIKLLYILQLQLHLQHCLQLWPAKAVARLIKYRLIVDCHEK